MMPSAMPLDAPLTLHRETVRREWIDYNGHMNVAHYITVWDNGIDVFFQTIGLDRGYIDRTGCSVFALEIRTLYLRELTEDQPVQTALQLLDFDSKRVHYLAHLLHGEEGWTAALVEGISVHVDLNRRRSAAFPPDMLERLAAMKSAHAGLPYPESLGRPLSLARR